MEYQMAMALGPNDPGDGDPGRQQRGRAIAALADIRENRLGYRVPSQSGKGSCLVMNDGEPFFTCPAFEKRQRSCRQVYAVKFLIQREERPYGTTIETQAIKAPKTSAHLACSVGKERLRDSYVIKILDETRPTALGNPEIHVHSYMSQ